jgi:hypothetical protein
MTDEDFQSNGEIINLLFLAKVVQQDSNEQMIKFLFGEQATLNTYPWRLRGGAEARSLLNKHFIFSGSSTCYRNIFEKTLNEHFKDEIEKVQSQARDITDLALKTLQFPLETKEQIFKKTRALKTSLTFEGGDRNIGNDSMMLDSAQLVVGVDFLLMIKEEPSFVKGVLTHEIGHLIFEEMIRYVNNNEGDKNERAKFLSLQNCLVAEQVHLNFIHPENKKRLQEIQDFRGYCLDVFAVGIHEFFADDFLNMMAIKSSEADEDIQKQFAFFCKPDPKYTDFSYAIYDGHPFSGVRLERFLKLNSRLWSDPCKKKKLRPAFDRCFAPFLSDKNK